MQSSLAPKYLLPFQWIAALAPTSHSFPLRCEYRCTLHQSVAQNQSDMWLSNFEIGTAQFLSVTEIASKSHFLCLNRGPTRYHFIAVTFFETRCFLSSTNRLKGQVSAASCHALGVVVVVNADNKSQCIKITVHNKLLKGNFIPWNSHLRTPSHLHTLIN